LEHVSFYPLLIVLALAFVVPLLLSRQQRLSVPAVVGEIVAGILIGRSGLNLIPQDTYLSIFSDLGFVFLMFLAGLELDFRPLTGGGSGRGRRVSSPLVLGSGSFLLTMLLSLGLAVLLVSWGMARSPWIMALVLGTTSLGVVLPVLREKGMSSRPYGQVLLVGALVADFATVVLVSVYAIVQASGLSRGILSFLVIAGLLLVAYVLITRRRVSRQGPLLGVISEAAGHLGVRGAFALALLFVALAQDLGVEVILGAFLAGALLSLLRPEEGWSLHEDLEVLGYGFLIPIFFVMVGVEFDLTSLINSPQALALVPVLLIGAYLVKLVPSLLFLLAVDWRRAIGGGFLLSSRLSLIIAVSAIGRQWGAITPATDSAIVLVAVVTCTLSPMLFSLLVPGDASEVDRIVVLGSGREARKTARRLLDRGENVVVLTASDDEAAELRKRGLEVIVTDPTSAAAQREARVPEARAVVAMLEDVERNTQAVESVCSNWPEVSVFAMALDDASAHRYEDCGARVIDYDLSPFWILETLLQRPSIFDLVVRGEGPDSTHEVAEVRLTNHSLVGRELRQLNLPRGALVMAIRRGRDFVIPRGPTRLQHGDVLTLAGNREAVEEFGALARG